MKYHETLLAQGDKFKFIKTGTLGVDYVHATWKQQLDEKKFAGDGFTTEKTWDGGIITCKIYHTPTSGFALYKNGVLNKTWNEASTGSGYHTIYINGRLDPEGTPTYLETLDKLDQWSSAQYIPNSRNKLNL